MSQTMRDINVSGGSPVIHVNPPSQQELRLESISDPITVKMRPKEKEYLENLARKRGQALSTMLRRIIFNHLKIEPRLHEVHRILDETLI